MDDSLQKLQHVVLTKMLQLGFTSDKLTELQKIPLGWLRKDATQRHGVTRFHPSVNLAEGYLSPKDVKTVDLHRTLVEEKYISYGEYVLFHEYCHCIGHAGHGAGFKSLEKIWPDRNSKSLGREMTDDLRQRRAKWLWTCPSCKRSHPRRRRSNGRYLCRKCKVHLIDEPGGERTKRIS